MGSCQLCGFKEEEGKWHAVCPDCGEAIYPYFRCEWCGKPLEETTKTPIIRNGLGVLGFCGEEHRRRYGVNLLGFLKVDLVSQASMEYGVYSIEAGVHDGKFNFDHHGAHGDNQSPCMIDLPVLSFTGKVEISHIDADVFLSLMKMLGMGAPSEVNLSLLEKIDKSGSSACHDKNEPTLFYSIGVGVVARRLGFPRVNEKTQDVTSLVIKLLGTPSEEIIREGKEAAEKSETAFRDCMVAVSESKKVGFWSITDNDPLDPSRPYEDGTEVVVIYRQHYKTVSIYCKPSSKRGFVGKKVAGIEFAGHPQACASPRGKEMSEEDGARVFQEICRTL